MCQVPLLRSGIDQHLVDWQGTGGCFDFTREYVWQEQLYGWEGRPPDPVLADGATANGAAADANSNDDAESGGGRHYGPQWVYLKLSQPVTAPAVRCGVTAMQKFVTVGSVRIWVRCLDAKHAALLTSALD